MQLPLACHWFDSPFNQGLAWQADRHHWEAGPEVGFDAVGYMAGRSKGHIKTLEVGINSSFCDLLVSILLKITQIGVFYSINWGLTLPNCQDKPRREDGVYAGG